MVTIVPDDPCVTQAAAWVWSPRDEAGAGFARVTSVRGARVAARRAPASSMTTTQPARFGVIPMSTVSGWG